MKLKAFSPISLKITFFLLDHIKARPRLHERLKRLAEWYSDFQGYRRYGLLKDDLVPETHPVVQEALKRLSDKELYDRTFRLVRASELHFKHETLPKEHQPTTEEDVRYLRKHMLDIFREQAELQRYNRK